MQEHVIEIKCQKFTGIFEALMEAAFSYYPLAVTIDGEERVCEAYSDVEKFARSIYEGKKQ